MSSSNNSDTASRPTKNPPRPPKQKNKIRSEFALTPALLAATNTNQGNDCAAQLKKHNSESDLCSFAAIAASVGGTNGRYSDDDLSSCSSFNSFSADRNHHPQDYDDYEENGNVEQPYDYILGDDPLLSLATTCDDCEDVPALGKDVEDLPDLLGGISLNSDNDEYDCFLDKYSNVADKAGAYGAVDDDKGKVLHGIDDRGFETGIAVGDDVSCKKDEEEDYEDGGPTIKTAARWIKNGECKRIVVVSGAGVSCSAGIPDFRTPGTGLYDNLQKYDLPYPEAVFDLDFYRHNPKPFVSLASEIWPGIKFSPTITHSFITLLHRKGLLLRNYTQNIDGLEVLSGLPEEKLVECHGHFRTASCIQCRHPYDGETCKRSILDDLKAPTCTKCRYGLVKPDIVFFKESLPNRFWSLVEDDIRGADLIIVVGTSLTVAPVSSLPQFADKSCRRLLLNRELVGDFVPPGVKGNVRDVFLEGDCDDSVLKLCQILGWEEELTDLNTSSVISGEI